MSPFWGTFFETIRERGRNATLFLVALVGLGSILIVACILEEIIGKRNFDDYGGRILTGLGALAIVWLALMIYRIFFRKPDRLKFSQLSSDELSKARSKLVKNQNRRSV